MDLKSLMVLQLYISNVSLSRTKKKKNTIVNIENYSLTTKKIYSKLTKQDHLQV